MCKLLKAPLSAPPVGSRERACQTACPRRRSSQSPRGGRPRAFCTCLLVLFLRAHPIAVAGLTEPIYPKIRKPDRTQAGSDMPPLLATGEAAALALAAVCKRVRVHVRVSSLSRTVRARTHVRVINFVQQNQLFCLSFLQQTAPAMRGCQLLPHAAA